MMKLKYIVFREKSISFETHVAPDSAAFIRLRRGWEVIFSWSSLDAPLQRTSIHSD